MLRAFFGKSAEEAAAAGEVEKLRISYMRASIDETTLSGDALKKFNEYLAETRRQALGAYRAKSAEETRQQRSNELHDLTRETTRDMISSPLKAIMHGRNPGEAMREAALRMSDKMVDMGVNRFMDALFGKQGEKGGLFGSGLNDLFSGSASWFASGGIMSSAGPIPLRRYAGGGVANSPQMAIFGEGSMSEAIVPLPDGRSIPVAMRGAGASAVPVAPVINVHNNAGVQVETKATRGGNGQHQIDVVLTGIIQNHIANNGPIARALQTNYGLNRSTGRG